MDTASTRIPAPDCLLQVIGSFPYRFFILAARDDFFHMILKKYSMGLTEHPGMILDTVKI